MGNVRVTYTIPFGSSLRIGYRAINSATPFTYLSTFPEAGDSPYTFVITPAGIYDVELTTMCPNCAGSTASDPVIFTVNVPT